jgi:CheY-like chemotaxis protein
MVRKVISIEDEPEIAELLRVVLFSPEIELHSADNGLEGLTLIRDIKPDLVVLDIMLPGGMSGWDVYDMIRADDSLKTTPIIMLSVMREEPERRRTFTGSEIDLYVTKPFDTLRLRREVERMVNQTGLWKPPAPPVAHAFGLEGDKLLRLPPDQPVMLAGASIIHTPGQTNGSAPRPKKPRKAPLEAGQKKPNGARSRKKSTARPAPKPKTPRPSQNGSEANGRKGPALE